MSDPEELVLCVPRSLFEEIGAFQGLSFDVDAYLPRFLDPANNLFVPRSAAERDPSFKQIIPYAVLTFGGKILHYVRGSKGGETRLFAKGSIGIGGHINPGDHAGEGMTHAAYLRAAEREIGEELRIAGSYRDKMLAVLNDDSTEVGQVHLGIVHVLTLDSDDVTAGEAAIADLTFRTVEDLASRRDSLETWSQVVFDGWPRLSAAQ